MEWLFGVGISTQHPICQIHPDAWFCKLILLQHSHAPLLFIAYGAEESAIDSSIKGAQQLTGMIEMFILIVMISWMQSYVKTDQIFHFKQVQSSILHLYPNKLKLKKTHTKKHRSIDIGIQFFKIKCAECPFKYFIKFNSYKIIQSNYHKNFTSLNVCTYFTRN